MFYLQHVYCVNLQIVVGKNHSPFFRCSLKVLSFPNCPSNCQDLHLTAKKVHVNQKLCFICINYSSARNSIVCMRLQYCDSIKFIQNKYNWIVKESEQKITCNLPWELSLYGHQQTQAYQPCTTDDQYKAKTVAMDAFVYGFLNPISQQYHFHNE